MPLCFIPKRRMLMTQEKEEEDRIGETSAHVTPETRAHINLTRMYCRTYSDSIRTCNGVALCFPALDTCMRAGPGSI